MDKGTDHSASRGGIKTSISHPIKTKKPPIFKINHPKMESKSREVSYEAEAPTKLIMSLSRVATRCQNNSSFNQNCFSKYKEIHMRSKPSSTVSVLVRERSNDLNLKCAVNAARGALCN